MRATLRLVGLAAALALLSGSEWDGPLGRLSSELSAPDPETRRAAVRRLADHPAREVGPSVLAALEDPAIEVRLEAARAATRLRLTDAGPRLLAWVDDPDELLREEAARALGVLGGAGAATALARALSDARATVRRAALEGLEALGDPGTAPAVVRALDDADAGVRAHAARALSSLGTDEASTALAARVMDDAPEVRAAVLAALGERRSATAAPLFVAALHDDVTGVRLAAIAAVGRARVELAAPALEPLARDPDPRIARAAVAALAWLDADTALAAVVEAALEAPARATAEAALTARAARAPEATTLAVAALLRGPDPTAARAAELLVLLAASPSTIGAGVPALLEAWAGRRGGLAVLRALGHSGARDALVPILVALGADAPDERAAAAEALRAHFAAVGADGRAVEPLLDALRRASDDERLALVDLVGATGAPRTASALVELARGAEPLLRARVARALGGIDAPAGRTLLLELVGDASASVRAEAALALGRTGTDVEARALADRLDREGSTDRHAVLEALGGIAARVSGVMTPALVARVAARARDEDDRLADAALVTLGRSAASEACASLRALRDTLPLARVPSVVRALGRCTDPESRRLLRASLESPGLESALAAAGVAGETGDGTEAAWLLEAMEHLAWPAGAAASFSIARLARRGLLRAETHAGPLCRLGAASHDPIVRANVAVALAGLGARCAEEPRPEAWLAAPRSAAVRSASARWLAATASLAPRGVAPEAVLEACRGDLASRSVADACADPSLAPLGDRVDVVAYAPDGRTLLAERWVALGLGDGTVLVARTDANARLVVEGAPRGRIWIDTPENLPLEP